LAWVGRWGVSVAAVLDAAIKSFAQAMREMQSANREFRRVLEKGFVPDDINREDLLKYVAHRRRAFSPGSTLRPFIKAEFHDKARSQQRSHVAILWFLNRMLWLFRDNYRDSANFLHYLTVNIEYEDGPDKSSRPTMKAWGLVYILANVAGKLTSRPSFSVGKDSETQRRMVFWLVEVLDVVELLELLPENTGPGL